MATTFTTSQPIQPWPATLKPSDMTLQLQFHTTSFASPFTRTMQTQELPGALFRLTASFPPMMLERVAPARAWMAKLRGSAGRFYWPANGTNFTIPSAYAAETVHYIPLDASSVGVTADRTDITIDATQIGYAPVFTPDGLSTDRTRLTGTLWLQSNQFPLKEGSYISFDDAQGWRHLHIIVGIEFDEDTGKSTVVVEPPMRSMPTPMTAIHVLNPSGVFKLNDDEQGAMRLSPGIIGSMGTIDAMQAFPLRVVV